MITELTDHEMLLEIWADVKELKDTYVGLRKTVYGNGGAGLVSKTTALELDVRRMSKALTWLGGTIGVLVIALVWRIITGEVSIVIH